MIKISPLPPGELPAAGAPYSCSPAWAELYKNIYRYDLRQYHVLRGQETIGGFDCALVRSPLFGTRLISLPFSDEPGIWLAPGVALDTAGISELKDSLVKELDALAAETGAAYAELRGADLIFPGEDARFVQTAPYLRLILDTKRPYEELRAAFNINIPKNLRKADKFVTVTESRNPADFAGVYGIYLRQMQIFGSPPLPAAHFERLLASGDGRLYTAAVGGRLAAFLFALVWDGIFYADVNAGLPEFETFFPKVKLFDETIKLACAGGLRRYDFMRTRAGSGVYEHKKKWGGREIPIKYFYRPYRRGLNLELDPEQARFALPKLLLRHAPLALLKAIGPAIRRHAGK